MMLDFLVIGLLIVSLISIAVCEQFFIHNKVLSTWLTDNLGEVQELFNAKGFTLYSEIDPINGNKFCLAKDDSKFPRYYIPQKVMTELCFTMLKNDSITPVYILNYCLIYGSTINEL